MFIINLEKEQICTLKALGKLFKCLKICIFYWNLV